MKYVPIERFLCSAISTAMPTPLPPFPTPATAPDVEAAAREESKTMGGT